MNGKLLLSTMLMASACGYSYALDHGAQGTTWPITEVDIRRLLVASASKVDWSKTQQHMKESAAQYLTNLPKRQMPVVNQSQTVWVDPSIQLSSDIQAPVLQVDGSYRWQILYTKGTLVNPLETSRPTTAMLFFDGADPAQVAFVQALLDKEPLRIVPVEAGAGNVQDTHALLRRPVFYASDAMVGRFQLRYLPSLVYTGEGTHRLRLGVSSFSLPFDPNGALLAWKQADTVNPSFSRKTK
jgi:conjugal transfer pilus assembly protein TraW